MKPFGRNEKMKTHDEEEARIKLIAAIGHLRFRYHLGRQEIEDIVKVCFESG